MSGKGAWRTRNSGSKRRCDSDRCCYSFDPFDQNYGGFIIINIGSKRRCHYDRCCYSFDQSYWVFMWFKELLIWVPSGFDAKPWPLDMSYKLDLKHKYLNRSKKVWERSISQMVLSLSNRCCLDYGKKQPKIIRLRLGKSKKVRNSIDRKLHDAK